MIERLRFFPGTRSVAAVNALPLRGPNNFPVQRVGHPDQSIGGMEIRIVTPAYFETMGIPIRRGRSFRNDDDGRGRAVIIVNETVVRRWWPQENPLGDHIAIGLFQGRPVAGATPDSEREVVGVVGDTKSVFIKAPPRPTVYIPVAEASAWSYSLTWIVRGAPTSFTEQLQKMLSDLDPRRRVTRVATMDDIVGSTTSDSRFNAVLFDAFAGLAVVLATIGIFGLLSFSVAQRTSEIGTRMALGASRNDVLRLVLKQGFVLLAAGLALGFAGSFVIMRSLSTLLFGVQPRDVFSYAMGAVLLLAAGLVASYLPARYAANVDPATALRSE
jgi:putative ABC transport system permease protein